jgi:dihydroxy-acid dehydratase
MLVLLEILGFTKIGILEYWFKDKKFLFLEENKNTDSSQSQEIDKQISDFIIWGGQRIVQMAKQKVSTKKILSQSAVHNALCTDAALGGSSEALLHLGAVAHEAGLLPCRTVYAEITKKVSQLVQMNRFGEFTLKDLQKCGGLHALLSALRYEIQTNPTVQGKGISDIIKENGSTRSLFRHNVTDKKIQTGMAVLSGNLARDGALFRTSGLKSQWLSSSGPAKVFTSLKACEEAVRSKKIKKGDVIVLPYCGPRGAPGMPCLQLKDLLEKHGLEDSVMIITDGRPDVLGKTPAIVQIVPEAAVGGPLAAIQDGDMISWNFAQRSLIVRLTETEIKVRLSRWKETKPWPENSFLNHYSRYALSSALGAVLGF